MAAAALALAGCTDPDVAGRIFACQSDDECGAGWVCTKKKVCAPTGLPGTGGPGGAGDADAGGADTGGADVASDAAGAVDAADDSTDGGIGDIAQDADGDVTGADAADVADPDSSDSTDGGGADAADAGDASGCVPASCDDGLPCTKDTCMDGTCEHEALSGFCPAGGVCNPIPAKDAPCGVCDPTLGWVASGDGAACDDGDGCTSGEVCDQGACEAPGVLCDDANVCTTDACTEGACTHTPAPSTCDDGDPCTIDDNCVQGACAPAFPPGASLKTLGSATGGPAMAASATTVVSVWPETGPGDGPVGGAAQERLLVAVSTNAGASFLPPNPLIEGTSGSQDKDRQPAIATDGAAEWAVVFSRKLAQSPGVAEIYAARSTEGGEITAASPIASLGGLSEWPAVAADGAGGFVAVWMFTPGGASGPGAPKHLVFSRLLPGADGWTPPQPLDGAAPDSTVDEGAPALAGDGSGTLMVAWSRERTSGGAGQGGHDLDVLVATSEDGGASWGAPVAVNDWKDQDLEGEDDFEPALATDGLGRWLVVWTTTFSPMGGPTWGADPDITGAFTTDGAQWQQLPPIVPWAETDASAERHPAVAADGTGGWIIAFATANPDFGGADADIATVWAVGDKLEWSPPALAVPGQATDAVGDSYPVIVARPTGGWAIGALAGDLDGDDPLTVWFSARSAAVPCSDGNSCTTESCGAAGCTPPVAAPSLCSDGDPCTSGDACDGTSCVAGPAVDCDDGNPCTTDSCNAESGCQHAPAAGKCSDDDACTVSDTCVDGACLPGTLDSCDDGNPCTIDSCDPQIGCANEATTGPCDDGDACTSGETCAGGACEGAEVTCDDGELCTTDLCDPILGCTFAPVAGSCDDSDYCTEDDACTLGVCAGTPLCDDGDPCTDDLCDADAGCLFPATTDCDGDPCTVDETCVGQICSAYADFPFFGEAEALVAEAKADGSAGDQAAWLAEGPSKRIAVWATASSVSGLGSDLDVVVSRWALLTGWSPPKSLWNGATADAGSDTAPHVAVGPSGVMAAWTSQSAPVPGGGSDNDIVVVFSADEGLTWGEPVLVASWATDDAATDLAPVVASVGGTKWMVIWSSDYAGGAATGDRDVWVARSQDNGATWSEPSPLNADAATDSRLDVVFPSGLATDGAGSFLLVWAGQESGGDMDLYASWLTFGDASWSPPELLWSGFATDSGDDTAPAVATNKAHTWAVVWESTNPLGGAGTDSDIFISTMDDRIGAWSVPGPISVFALEDGAASDTEPSIAISATSTWTVAWSSKDPTIGIGTDADILVVSSQDAGATWTSATAVNAFAESDAADDLSVRLLATSNGSFQAVWRSFHDLGGAIGSDDDLLRARWTPTMTPCDDLDSTTLDVCTPSGCENVPF